MRSEERRRVPLTPPAAGERRGVQAPSPRESDRRPPAQSRETPPPVPPQRDNSRRDVGRDTVRDSGSGRGAERDEARRLPGNPANRMAPKRRGAADDEEEENSGRGRRN
jgi:hypothetical protein